MSHPRGKTPKMIGFLETFSNPEPNLEIQKSLPPKMIHPEKSANGDANLSSVMDSFPMNHLSQGPLIRVKKARCLGLS